METKAMETKMYEIDIRDIQSKKEFHELLRETLPLPDYYGNNLDALYDVLTETSDEMNICFVWNEERETIPEEVEKLIAGLKRMCADVEDECPNIKITWANTACDRFNNGDNTNNLYHINNADNHEELDIIDNADNHEEFGIIDKADNQNRINDFDFDRQRGEDADMNTPSMSFRMVHENYNVQDIDASLDFYKKALGLKEKRRSVAADGSYIIVFIGNEHSDFELELTWLAEHPYKYDIGEEEFHLAFRTDDFDGAHKLHEEMGCICFENPEMGIYFIQDPDGYWLEILPQRR